MIGETSMLGFLLLFFFFTSKKNCIKRRLLLHQRNEVARKNLCNRQKRKTKKLCTRRKGYQDSLEYLDFDINFLFFVFYKKIVNSLEKKG